jgi:predicted metal-dependent phosphotriesterase family hydrolase
MLVHISCHPGKRFFTMKIMSVQGPIPASELGFTLSHTHFMIDLWQLVRTYDGILDDEALATQELLDYKSAGGCSVVEVTSGGIGRNPEALRRLSQASGVHIIMGAAWYREAVYPKFIYELDTNALAAVVVGELTEGIDGTDVRAGVIGEIGTERGAITPAQERVFRACARAQQKTGVTIVTHTTHFGELALEQIALLQEELVPSSRILISHLGDRVDTTSLKAIARQGVFLGIDNIGFVNDGYATDRMRARNVAWLIAEGHLLQILLSSDFCFKTQLAAYGGKGYTHVPNNFLPLLRDEGVSEEAIHQMTVINPMHALAVDETSIVFEKQA